MNSIFTLLFLTTAGFVALNSGFLLLPNSSVIHQPSTPTFISHIGEYEPNEHITNFSVIIPMTAAYCPIIPMKAARKIPACDYLHVGGRDRRFLFDLINSGVG
ncbi:unnamed protein product, partial [Didymodactylos carnosus]